jgi:hypothetical protein
VLRFGLFALSFFLLEAGSRVAAQDVARPDSESARILHFTKPAYTIAPPINEPRPVPMQVPTIAVAPSIPPAPPPRVAPARVLPASPAPFSPKAQSAAPSFPIQRAMFQQKGPIQSFSQEELAETLVQLEPPGPQRLFRLESEAALQERMRQEARQRLPPERIAFPEEPLVGRGPFVQRTFPARDMLIEPNYVCYGRLYFEEKNSERYGWDLGFIQPLVSSGVFYWDLITLPYHFWTNPCQQYECSAGYCLPGDPVPFLLYPPQISMTGALAEAGTLVGLFAIFP